jgi:hypothetical protein
MTGLLALCLADCHRRFVRHAIYPDMTAVGIEALRFATGAEGRV